jgi:signal transduction histidine kinase/DNA-binding NarL/FixJ family response regulator
VSVRPLASAPRRSQPPALGVAAPGAATPGAATPGTGAPGAAAAHAAGLIAVAQDLAGEFSLRPLLERILLHCTGLLGCDAGSICSVDEAAGTYRKEADIGVACQSGQVFPLTEGMTGAVVARRGPAWFARYGDVRGGHVAPEARASLRGVIGVPIEWRGAIIGACIVFSRDAGRSFGPADAELLRLFAQHAAVALANARMHELAEERARAEAATAERARLLHEVHDTIPQRLVSVRVHLDLASQANGDARIAPHLHAASTAAREALAESRLTLLGLADSPLDGRTLEAALRSEAVWAESVGRLEVRFVSAGQPAILDSRVAGEVVRVAREALTNIVRHARARSARLGLVYEHGNVSLLVQDDGEGFDARADELSDRFGLRAMTSRARQLGGTIDLDSLPGWGTRIRARFPCAPGTGPDAAGAPLTRLRVLVVAGPPVVRAGIARLLSWAEPNIEVVGEAASTAEAAQTQEALQPDVVLAAIEPGDAAGTISLLRGQTARSSARPAIVALCDSADQELAAEAVSAGALGCVHPEMDGPELARAVLAAGRGEVILSGPVLRELHRGQPGAAQPDLLTDREREVRGLMEAGLPDKVIAEQLVLSVKTVEKHAGAVLRKTGARNRTELAALAYRPRRAR